MSYRRPSKSVHSQAAIWQRWLSENAELIQRSGVPASVLRTAEDWWYFVENTYYRPFRHGDDEQLRWFEVDQLDRENRRALWELILNALNVFFADHQTKYPDWLGSLESTYGPRTWTVE